MSHKKIIKQKIDKYENPEIVDLKENNQKKLWKCIFLPKYLRRKEKHWLHLKWKKMLSDFKTEINANMVTMITTLKNEVKSNMLTMEDRINSKIIEVKFDIVGINSRIDNLKYEMNNRFDKLELRVTTLEGFHKADFAKN